MIIVKISHAETLLVGKLKKASLECLSTEVLIYTVR